MSNISTRYFNKEEKEEKNEKEREDKEDKGEKDKNKENKEQEAKENKKDKEGEGNNDIHDNLDSKKMQTAHQVCDPMSYQCFSVYSIPHITFLRFCQQLDGRISLCI